MIHGCLVLIHYGKNTCPEMLRIIKYLWDICPLFWYLVLLDSFTLLYMNQNILSVK